MESWQYNYFQTLRLINEGKERPARWTRSLRLQVKVLMCLQKLWLRSTSWIEFSDLQAHQPFCLCPLLKNHPDPAAIKNISRDLENVCISYLAVREDGPFTKEKTKTLWGFTSFTKLTWSPNSRKWRQASSFPASRGRVNVYLLLSMKANDSFKDSNSTFHYGFLCLWELHISLVSSRTFYLEAERVLEMV